MNSFLCEEQGEIYVEQSGVCMCYQRDSTAVCNKEEE